MFDRVVITPLPFLARLQAFNLQSTTSLKNGLFTGIFQGFSELSRNDSWTAASKETDVIIKSAFI